MSRWTIMLNALNLQDPNVSLPWKSALPHDKDANFTSTIVGEEK